MGSFYNVDQNLKLKNNYRWTLLYAKDRDQKIRLAYNEFAYKNNKDTYKLRDRFLKKGQFSIAYTHITRSACTLDFFENTEKPSETK
jgi:hypothetical protein